MLGWAAWAVGVEILGVAEMVPGDLFSGIWYWWISNGDAGGGGDDDGNHDPDDPNDATLGGASTVT